MKVVGIDLAGKPKNPTGFCVLTDNFTETKLVYSDEDIQGILIIDSIMRIY